MIAFEKVKNAFASKDKKLALQSIAATGVANGLLLDMTIRQHYKNETNKLLEVIYSFPMAWGATFMGMQAEIGGGRLVGAVIEKANATEQYEKAIADGDAPIMIEKNSDGIYTANLGNLKPNDEVVIEYSYSQLLKYEQDSIRLSIPTVIAPRYGDAKKGGIEEHQSVSSDFLTEYPFTLTLQLTGGLEKATIECPSHQIQVAKQDQGLSVLIEREAYLDRDFILNLTGLKNQSFCIVTPDKQLGPEGCTVLASFCPPTVDKQRVNSLDLKILVDCSGSMEGDSIQSAKRALHHVLSHLTVNDRFSYTKFGSHTNHLFSAVKSADQFHLSAASLLIENTKADMGGTEVEAALQSTFDLMGAQGNADVLLITDGEVWSTDETIAAAKKSGHRIFAVGVGSAPAETLLKELAEMSGGACELISPNEDIEKAILRMFHRIRQPKASNIEINWGHQGRPEWVIGTNTAIFSENTIHVFAGFKSTPSKPAILSYQLRDSAQRIDINAPQIIHSESKNLTRLATAQRIKTAPEGEQIALALGYQLITDHTNCLLVHIRDEDKKAAELPELMTIAQMHAAGWGGAGSVLHSSSQVQFSVAPTSRHLRLNNSCASFDAYDMPRVFRSSHSAVTPMPTLSDLNSFTPSSKAMDNNPDYYDIPAFLRKQAYEIDQSEPKLNQLAPAEVIDIANTSILNKALLTDFVQRMDQSSFEDDVLEMLTSCLQFLSKEQLWITVLAWLLLHLEGTGNWNEKTKNVIQELANEMDAVKLNKAFQVFNAKINDIGMHSWMLIAVNDV